MSDQFLGEIRMFGGNFAPVGWALCNGALLPISQNTALFSLLGTSFGGDGRVTFGLPDLTARIPLQQGQGPGLSQRVLGEQGGSATVTLLANELPAHTHAVGAVDAAGDSTGPTQAHFAQAYGGRVADRVYATGPPDQSMHPASSGIAGGGQPHDNLPPYLVLTFIIALQGIFPPRS